MQSDLSDGVRSLADKGVIDASRVCIVGSGYGGYAALAGAALGGDVYRCAVSAGGMSDISRATAFERGRLSKLYWLRFMGVQTTQDPKLNELSPIRHIDKIKIPILLFHGKDDDEVDYSQSQAMYDALIKAGKPVDLVTLYHEGHWPSMAATRLEMLQATMAFLQKNNPP